MLWFAPVLCVLCLLSGAKAGKVCSRPPYVQSAASKPEKFVFEPGESVTYTCRPGYIRHAGSNKVTCSITGTWSHPTLACKPRACAYPGPLENGDLHHEDLTFQSWIRFSCHDGYILHGANVSSCTETGQWSQKLPVCEPVTCRPPPIPEFGRLATYFPNEGNLSTFRDVVKYECLPTYALFGNETATCGANGNWSQVPECRDVKCQRPPELQNGFMTFSTFRKYNYKEVVTYGCNPTYVLEGQRHSFCEKDGEWSPKPTCRAPCQLTVKKAVVLYNGNKIDIQKISNRQIHHADIIGFYCTDEPGKCGYPADTQCLDGTITIPSCFKEIGFWNWLTKDPSGLPSCT